MSSSSQNPSNQWSTPTTTGGSSTGTQSAPYTTYRFAPHPPSAPTTTSAGGLGGNPAVAPPSTTGSSAPYTSAYFALRDGSIPAGSPPRLPVTTATSAPTLSASSNPSIQNLLSRGPTGQSGAGHGRA